MSALVELERVRAREVELRRKEELHARYVFSWNLLRLDTMLPAAKQHSLLTIPSGALGSIFFEATLSYHSIRSLDAFVSTVAVCGLCFDSPLKSRFLNPVAPALGFRNRGPRVLKLFELTTDFCLL